MIIKPLRNKVAVKEFVKEQSTSSLVIVGSVNEETPEFGVVAVGPEVVDVQVGDRVLIEMGKAVVFNNDTLLIEDKFITAILD